MHRLRLFPSWLRQVAWRSVALVLGASLTWLLAPTAPSAAPQSLVLLRPAWAAPADDGIAALLDQEAGIAAYFRAPGGIQLSQVRSQFRTIELETSEYVLGSVAVPGYSIAHDAHVYINQNGWVLAYYLAADPAGKIFDVNAYTGPTIPVSKLQNVLSVIASAAGAPLSSVSYYDFRYPNATHMMLIASYSTYSAGAATFQINPTSTYGYFHRSYFLGGCAFQPTLDGSGIGGAAYGMLSASQLQTDTNHTMAIPSGCSPNGSAFGGLVLIYRVP